jgi:hypothetical protein
MMLPPDPEMMNDERAAWAWKAIEMFMDVTGCDESAALADLMCNLMHACDRFRDEIGGFDEQLDRARGFYREETSE